MTIAAAKHSQEPGQQRQRSKVQPQLPDRRPHQGSNENQVATAFLPRKSAKTVDLTQANPMMRVGRHSLRIGASAQREQYGAALAPRRGFGHCERQAPAAADNANRGAATRGGSDMLIVRSIHPASTLDVAAREAKRTVARIA